jgi:hypothetical protein
MRHFIGQHVVDFGADGATGETHCLAHIVDWTDSRPSTPQDARIRRPRPVPPRIRTPLVHATHVRRITRAMLQGHTVLAHTRGTWPQILYGFAWLARRRGTDMHLILLDVSPQVALAGQYARGRAVTAITFARHRRRWRVLIDRARTGGLPPAASVTVLDRPAADLVHSIRFAA